jgi:hypothetical protein
MAQPPKKPKKPVSYTRFCAECRREYHSGGARHCPKHGGAVRCRYCCMKCENNIFAGTGQECSIVRAEREAAQEPSQNE